MRCTLFLCLSTALFLSACSPAAEPETKTATDAPAPAAAADMHAGSWTLNVAKSTYTPGPAPKESDAED